MEQKETQRHRGQMVVSSLPPDCVPPDAQSITNPERTLLPENSKRHVVIVFVRMEQIIQLLARCTSLVLAIVNSITTHRVVMTLLFLGLATGTFSIRDAMDTISHRIRSRPSRRKNHQVHATPDENHSRKLQSPTEHRE